MMKQSRTSPTFDSAAETVQYHAVPAGSVPAAVHLVPRRLPAAWLLPGSLPLGAADLPATTKCTHGC